MANRDALCRLLWRDWSPLWHFDDATFARTAEAFHNPDFVDIVVHSYRHRFGLVAGDPVFDPLEELLAGQPWITVPTIVLRGDADGVDPPQAVDEEAPFFTGAYELRHVPGAGHNLPQEASTAFASAVLALT